MNNISILLKIFLKLDYRDRDSISYRKIIGAIVSYLIAGTGLSLNYFLNYEYLSCIILVLTFNSFLILFLVISEYPNLFFSQPNIDLIKSLPISFSEFIISKIASAYFYILFFSTILSIPQSILFILINKKIILYSANFFLVSVLFSIFLTLIILIIYTFVIKLFSEKASFLLYLFQVLFIFLILSSTSYSSKTTSHDNVSILTYSFSNYLPQYFFAQAIENNLYLLLIVILTVFLSYLFYIIIKKNFNDILYKLTFLKKERRFSGLKFLTSFNKLNEIVEKLLLKSPEERAGYYITKKVITGSRSMILKFIPILFMPLVIAFIGVLSNNKTMLLISNEFSNIGILSPTITLLILMIFRVTTSNLKFSDENSDNVDWIYESLPILNPKYVYKGCIKFVHLNYLIPLIILLTITLSLKINIEIILLNILFILPVAITINKITIIRLKVFPFTIETNKLNAFARFGEVFVSLFFGFILFFLQLLIFRNITYILLFIIFILILNIFLNHLFLNYDAGSRTIRFGNTRN
ncbi:MAG: hypothetical protein N2490_06265 [Ignavibacteria bacterium]|nr:hypothetical protein [Ignavibacteria bacterium]